MDREGLFSSYRVETILAGPPTLIETSRDKQAGNSREAVRADKAPAGDKAFDKGDQCLLVQVSCRVSTTVKWLINQSTTSRLILSFSLLQYPALPVRLLLPP